MPKIVLGKRPETVTMPAKFEHLDGTKDAINVQFRYRTRKEYGEFIDSVAAAATARAEQEQKAAESKPADVFSLEAFLDTQDGTLADQIVGMASGWDLAEPLTRETALQLATEFPAAANAIVQTYRAAIMEGRRGN